MSQKSTPTLKNAVDTALEVYIKELNGEAPCGLHKMVILEVEKSLFEKVMHLSAGNQSEAAKILGINRNTLRSRLGKFDML